MDYAKIASKERVRKPGQSNSRTRFYTHWTKGDISFETVRSPRATAGEQGGRGKEQD